MRLSVSSCSQWEWLDELVSCRPPVYRSFPLTIALAPVIDSFSRQPHVARWPSWRRRKLRSPSKWTITQLTSRSPGAC